MLFKQKIILATLILFIAVLDINSYIFMKFSEKAVLETEYQRAKNEQSFIIKNINDILKYTKPKDVQTCKDIVKSYKTFYKFYAEDIVIYEGEYIPENNDNIIINENLESPYDKLTLVYIKDIENIRRIKTKQTNILIYINIFSCILLVTFVYIVVCVFTKPMNEILKNIRVIKNGDYDKRLLVNTKDEFAEIAEEFNNMAISIKGNIVKLEKAIYEKQTLAENMAHELRNPLTSIKGFSEYLLKGNISENNKITALNYIYSETQRLQKLCNKILDISMMKYENINPIKLSIDKITTEIQTIYVNNTKDIRLNFNIKSKYIFGDYELIISLISNIIDNAINASKNKSKVDIEFSEDTNYSYLKVFDTGCGTKNTQDIFKPFFRDDKARSRENGGVGLGLSFCKSIVDLHNGKIYINSQVGEGTVVTVILPYIQGG